MLHAVEVAGKPIGPRVRRLIARPDDDRKPSVGELARDKLQGVILEGLVPRLDARRRSMGVIPQRVVHTLHSRVAHVACAKAQAVDDPGLGALADLVYVQAETFCKGPVHVGERVHCVEVELLGLIVAAAAPREVVVVPVLSLARARAVGETELFGKLGRKGTGDMFADTKCAATGELAQADVGPATVARDRHQLGYKRRDCGGCIAGEACDHHQHPDLR